MDRRLDGLVMRATAVLLTAGLLLVAAGTAGVSGSLGLVVALALVGGALYLAAESVDVSDAGEGLRSIGHRHGVGAASLKVPAATAPDDATGISRVPRRGRPRSGR
jgi:hypothetical protein